MLDSPGKGPHHLWFGRAKQSLGIPGDPWASPTAEDSRRSLDDQQRSQEAPKSPKMTHGDHGAGQRPPKGTQTTP